MVRGLHQISISICLFCLSLYICAISVPCGKTCRIETSFSAIEVAFHFQQCNVVPVELVMLMLMVLVGGDERLNRIFIKTDKVINSNLLVPELYLGWTTTSSTSRLCSYSVNLGMMVKLSFENTSHFVIVARGEQHLLNNINTRWLDHW